MRNQVYILTFNNEPLGVSKNITVLIKSMYARCAYDKMQAPLQYATVRRRIVAHGSYVHLPRLGWEYKIREMELIKKPIQHKLDLFQDTVVKQSSARSGVTRDNHSAGNSDTVGDCAKIGPPAANRF